jgi:hypothetical protein
MVHSRVLRVALLLLAIGGGQIAPRASAADRAVLRLRAFAVNMSGVGPATAGVLDVAIERWSTDEERDRLHTALVQGGQQSLLSALQKLKRAGYIRSPNDIGWPIHYARQSPTPDGGRRIVLATDRPMGFWEIMNRPRSAEYEFTLAEIRVGKDGKGEGKVVTPAKVTWNRERGAIEITNYGTEPVRLTQVTVEDEEK